MKEKYLRVSRNFTNRDNEKKKLTTGLTIGFFQQFNTLQHHTDLDGSSLTLLGAEPFQDESSEGLHLNETKKFIHTRITHMHLRILSLEFLGTNRKGRSTTVIIQR